MTGVTLAACGGSSDDGGGGASLSLAELPGAIARTQCEVYQRCFGDLSQLVGHGEDCVKLTEERVKNGEIGQLQAAVDAGKVKYDGAKAVQCLDEIAARSCDELTNRTSETCDAAAEGSAALGESCNHDFECKGMAFCRIEGACPGKCSERLTAGASCEIDDDCQDGLVCSKSTQACVKPAANGQPCGGGAQPECAPTLFCVGADAQAKQPGTCKPLSEVFAGKAGDECAFQDGKLCSPDLSCIYDAPPPAKGKCGARVQSGAACKRMAVPSMCPLDEYCDGAPTANDGTCKALPGAGQPCANVLGDEVCAPYHRCEGGKCVAMQANGGPCTDDATCYSETCEDGACKVNACQ